MADKCCFFYNITMKKTAFSISAYTRWSRFCKAMMTLTINEYYRY